ncbi:hypothetical protein O181_030352, partial [Austropuccinia psidii MF-1]|nr:hypothetical protein [Austropuccinia psidii MF-1]
MASESHQRAPVIFVKGVPLKTRENANFNYIGLIVGEPQMVHIWYYVPLCTIFPQYSNGKVFRTKLCHLNSTPQIHHPFQRKTSQPCSLAIHGSVTGTLLSEEGLALSKLGLTYGGLRI